MATAVLIVGLALLAAVGYVSQWTSLTAEDKAGFSALGTSLVGVNIGVLSISVLGVLLISSEFASGSVSSTLAAVPKRLPVLWGKPGVYSVVALAGHVDVSAFAD